MEYFFIILFVFLFFGLLGVLMNIEPLQYDPMNPDDEREWLMGLGLTEKEVDELMSIR